jgi:hypothetical protein
MGLVVAFGSSEVLMLAACIWLAPRGAFERGALLDFGRAVVVGAATLGLFSWLPPLTPWLTLPASVVTFGILALAAGLVRREDVTNWRSLLRRR